MRWRRAEIRRVLGLGREVSGDGYSVTRWIDAMLDGSYIEALRRCYASA